MMASMTSGQPCIACQIRGNVDLLKDSKDGYLCEVDDYSGFCEKNTENRRRWYTKKEDANK